MSDLLQKPKRADALRNYEKLVAAARDALTEADREASLEDIARRAGVGIATLYRNFPTRADLIEAVYVGEVEGMCAGARDLAELEPWDALSTWLHRFVGYVATKQALAEELFTLADREVFEGCRRSLHTAGATLLARAQAAGAVRPDVSIDDVVRLAVGIAKAPTDDPESTHRVLDLALDGLRFRPA